jgi:hypothetical protein
MTKTIASTLAFFALAAPASASIDLREATQAASHRVQQEARRVWRAHDKRDRVDWRVWGCHYVSGSSRVDCKMRVRAFHRDTSRVDEVCRGKARVRPDLSAYLVRNCVR